MKSWLEATIEEFDAKSLGYSIYLNFSLIGVISCRHWQCSTYCFWCLLVAGFGALTCLKYLVMTFLVHLDYPSSRTNNTKRLMAAVNTGTSHKVIHPINVAHYDFTYKLPC